MYKGSVCFSNRPIQIDNCYKFIVLLSTISEDPFEMCVSSLNIDPSWDIQQYVSKACKINYTHQKIQQPGTLHKMYAVCIYVNPYFQF